MQLVSVNVSLPRTLQLGGRRLTTGIFKEPVPGRVMLRTLNLDGDGQADPRYHGGPDKAAYAYPLEHYERWKSELGRDDLPFGQFGENFTISGMLEDRVRIGDVYRIGGAQVQVTDPRAPCFKLGLKMGSRDFQKLFLASGRLGFYLRVLEEGDVGAGDPIELLRTDPTSPTVFETGRARFGAA
jgi:MOSC domain-containing protein YiiM